jgi:hypothetical protein
MALGISRPFEWEKEQAGPHKQRTFKGPFIMITAVTTGLFPSFFQYRDPSPELEINHSFNHSCKTNLLLWMVETRWPR